MNDVKTLRKQETSQAVLEHMKKQGELTSILLVILVLLLEQALHLRPSHPLGGPSLVVGDTGIGGGAASSFLREAT